MHKITYKIFPVSTQQPSKLTHTSLSNNEFIDLMVLYRGTRQHSWLRHYATSQKVMGSSPDEVDFFFNLSNTSSHTMALGGKGRPAQKADNLTAICEPTV
jgi:hypothetical protein